MEKFVFFFRGGTEEKRSERWSGWMKSLEEQGALIESSPLLENGKIVKDEGETVQDFTFKVAEHARGFAIIQAENLEEAVTLSKDCPVFDEGGNVTIRPMSDTY
jgi:hypothetical protein